MKPWNPQYKTLDLWRGIAALWVMIFHGFGTIYEKPLHPYLEFLKVIAAPGWLGVHLFFVISGYCIAANVYKLLLNHGNAWDFLRSRILRLLPTYWAAFLVTIALNLISSPFNKTTFLENFPSSLSAWIGNLLLIQPYLNTPFYVVVYWSLAVEIGFYLIVGILVLFYQKFNQNIAIFMGLTLGIVSIFIISDPKLNVLAYWSEFICGMLVFSALLTKFQGKNYKCNISLSLLLIFGILGAWIEWKSHSGQVWFSALFGIILYFIYFFDLTIVSISQLRWLQFVGSMSYSLYLIHVPFQGRVINLGLRFVPPESWAILLVQVVGWSVAIIASYLFYQFVEKPLDEWRHHQKKSIIPDRENSINSRS